MTNAMIIMIESQKLVEQGVLQYTGKTLRGVNALGEEVEYQEIEPIHTFQGWKKLGYCVKKGEKSKIKFPIWFWKKGKKKESEDGDEEVTRGNCYMKTASWFTFNQVAELQEKKEQA